MLKLVVSGIKLLAAVALLFISGMYHFPAIWLIIPLWYTWVLFASRDRRKRFIATFGAGMTAAGYWCETSLWHYFATRVEMSHVRADGDYWSGMAFASEQVATVLTLSGLLVLAYADYLRPLKLDAAADTSSVEDTDKRQIWPPAPKQPQ